MSLTDHERIFIQNQEATTFTEYLRSVWLTWPTLTYNQARKTTAKLWKAHKAIVKSIEAIRNHEAKRSSFHEIWQEPQIPKTALTVTCWGCTENLANQLGHMDYGGCLYPLLPSSPDSTA